MKLKGKKIAIFNALPHHSKFLFPIAEEARKQRAEILFFTSLVDYPYEKEVLAKGFKCRFLFEYATEQTRTTIKSATRQLLDTWSKVNLSWHGFRHWPLFQQHRSLIRNIDDYFCLEELIKKERPHMFISLHEMNPWGKQIGHLSHKYSIPFITLQEGDYYNPMINFSIHSEYSVANLVWGNQTRTRLIDHKCPNQKLIIIGNTHIDDAIKRYTAPAEMKRIRSELSIPEAAKTGSTKVVTFMPNSFWGGARDKALWSTLLAGLKRPDITCVFKWHPQVAYPIYEEIKKIILEIMPGAIVVFTYDPYKILAVSDYCVVMGKTTLGVEALAFGKPLFDLYNIVDGVEHFAAQGVAQSVSPAGNWAPLLKTMSEGVPEEITKNTAAMLEDVFYRLDGKSVERAIDVITYILNVKHEPETRPRSTPLSPFDSAMIPGRVSFIIPSGSDLPNIMLSLTFLSKNVTVDDIEIIVVITDQQVKGVLLDSCEDVTFIDCDSKETPTLYNAGLKESTGETIVFLMPGVIVYKIEDFLQTASATIAGIPLYNCDMTLFSAGIDMDFNYSPRNITDSGCKAEFVSSLAFGLPRSLIEKIGAFEEKNLYFIIDTCRKAQAQGLEVVISGESIAIVHDLPTFLRAYDFSYHSGDWRDALKTFIRWHGTFQKDDDYITHAENMLKIK